MSMTTAQLAAVSFLARYAGHTHELYSYQLRRWFEWCEGNGLDPLAGIQRAAFQRVATDDLPTRSGQS